jgi:hypothetical protein
MPEAFDDLRAAMEKLRQAPFKRPSYVVDKVTLAMSDFQVRRGEVVHDVGTRLPDKSEPGDRFWVKIRLPDDREDRLRLWVSDHPGKWLCAWTEARNYTPEELMGDA